MLQPSILLSLDTLAEAAASALPLPLIASPELPTPPSAQTTMPQAVLENLLDGILLVSPDGTILAANQMGWRLCQVIQTHSPTPQADGAQEKLTQLPLVLLEACWLLRNSQWQSALGEALPQANLTVAPKIRVRIWLGPMMAGPETLFVVVLEDEQQSAQHQARTDQRLYGLTPREQEVWYLRLQNYSYQEIADQLYLSVDTVKRHVKSILAKQRQWQVAWQGLAAD